MQLLKTYHFSARVRCVHSIVRLWGGAVNVSPNFTSSVNLWQETGIL